VTGDSRRGAQLFQDRRCIECHSFLGKGGTLAPDLGRRSEREYTPDRLAGVMWNHAPAMWQLMAQKGITVPSLEEQDAADLYAYFFSLRYFARPADAARGKAVFDAKHCSRCHDLRGSRIGPPVAEWHEVSDPIAWIREMWNHSGKMYQRMRQMGIRWPHLTEQELVDLLVYLQHLPETRAVQAVFAPADPREGQALFEHKGCLNCHTLGTREANKINLLALGKPWLSMAEFASVMWNHAPQMHRRAEATGGSVPTFSGAEMNHLVGYLFLTGFFQERGDARRGRRVFVRKQCASCHEQKAIASAPDLNQFREGISPVFMTAALWKHGPKMLEAMKQRGISWPLFSGSEMADLIAYLKSGKP